jgi:hypothetical protein
MRQQSVPTLCMQALLHDNVEHLFVPFSSIAMKCQNKGRIRKNRSDR